jgi:hypothetical protein
MREAGSGRASPDLAQPARRPARGEERTGTLPRPFDLAVIDGWGASSSLELHAREEA